MRGVSALRRIKKAAFQVEFDCYQSKFHKLFKMGNEMFYIYDDWLNNA